MRKLAKKIPDILLFFFLCLIAYLGGLISWIIYSPNSTILHTGVYCQRREIIGRTTVKSGELLYSKDDVYIVSGYYETYDLSEDGNGLTIIESGYDDSNTFWKEDCISKYPPKMYEDKIRRFIKLQGYYFE